MGTLAFAIRGRDSFSGEDIQFLYTISQYAAVTLDRAQKEKRLRNSEERFRDMVETVPDIIFTVLPDGRRDYVSPRFYEVTGMPPGTGLGMGWMQALHPADVEWVQLAWQQSTQKDQPYDVEYRLRIRSGGYRWYFARAKPIRGESNRVIRWFGVATDIEDLKQSQVEVAQAQAQLAQHAAELENTVRHRTAELRETISQLESFFYTVAHDLRAPIRTIEGYSQVLLEDYGQVLEEQAKKLLENMARAARRLDALTRDVLNYTKMSTQAIELKPVDPVEIVQDVLVMNPALQAPKANVITRRPMHPVLANATLLSQCLSNLLNNAIKFVTPEVIPRVVIRSERIDEEVEAAPGGAAPAAKLNPHSQLLPGTPPPRPLAQHRVRLWIEDNGIGMDAETQQKIFGIFERARGSARFAGTGIGLAIVAKAVQRMGGRYGVESRLGQGSRFWIELAAA